MPDEVTSGFTTIEEDNSTSSDAEKHLKIEIEDFLGDGSNLRTYLNLGAWSPAAAAGTVSSGQLAAAHETAGAPDPSGGYTRDESGDDLLAPFLYNLYLDDTRDRTDGDDSTEGNVATPGVDYSAYATAPGLDAVQTDSHQTWGGETPYYMDADLRAAVTAETPSYVGWRDHTEGHRITTTRGDKIEVVGGNYKLFVLGRGSGTVHTDWSGGHLVDTMEAAGNITSINWRKVPTGDDDDERGWQWVEETVKGNVIQRFHGTHKTEHYGDEIITIIGRSDESAATAVATADDMGHWDEVDDDAEGDNLWDIDVPAARSKPKVVEQAFVSSEYEETIAADYLTDIDHSVVIDNYVGCKPTWDDSGDVATSPMGGALQFFSSIAGEKADVAFQQVTLDSTNRSDGAGLVREYLYADNHAQIERAQTIVEELYAGYSFGRFTAPDEVSGMMDVREVWVGFFYEQFFGVNTQMFMAGYFTVGVAVRVEAFLGLEAKLNVGAYLEAKLLRFNVSLGGSIKTLCKVDAAMNEVEAVMTRLDTTLATAKAGLQDTRMALFRNLGPV
jgi:hypothetical protein